MVEIDLDLSELDELEREINDIRDRFEEEVVYIVGTNVEYGVYLEFGTEDMPPYPWFRPAIREFEANPESFMLEHSGVSSVDDINSTEELVKAVSTALSNRMTDNVNAQGAGGRSPGTHPEHPRRQSGNLSADISATRIQ